MAQWRPAQFPYLNPQVHLDWKEGEKFELET